MLYKMYCKRFLINVIAKVISSRRSTVEQIATRNALEIDAINYLPKTVL